MQRLPRISPAFLFALLLLVNFTACSKQQPPATAVQPTAAALPPAPEKQASAPQPVAGEQSPSFEDHIRRSGVLFNEGKLTEALAALQAAGRLAPARYEAPALAALVWHAAGQADEARQALADARKLAPAEKQAGLNRIESELTASAPAQPAAPLKTTVVVPVATQAVATPPSANAPTAEQRRHYNVLILVMEDAEKAADLSSRQRIMGEFLEQSAIYLKNFPDDGRVWTLRALACIELDRADDGILAARALERLGLANSAEPKITRLVANLDRKGWSKGKTAEERRAANRRVADLGLWLIWIEPGEFSMGSGTGDRENERPVTSVAFSRGFWLGQTEVTQAQWEGIMGGNPAFFKGGSLPVEQVSWDEAMEFCGKLTERERARGRLPDGYAYTLPTEAQWEYACRAGTTGDYAGSLDAMAWYDKNSDTKTHHVGQKQANAWGLYDMHGNVWEWCADPYGNYPGGGVTDPAGPSSGTNRVVRGGSCFNSAGNCRSAYRDRYYPGNRGSGVGVRLALSSVQ